MTGRPRGSGIRVGVPACPRPGHQDRHVRLDGTYGKSGRKRQRYKCVSDDGAELHVFAGPLPRQRAAASSCDECENPIHSHQGPASPMTYSYPVRDVAEALVAVGRGKTYTETAARARTSAGRAAASGGYGAQLVMNWVEIFTDVVCAEAAEDHWPETLLLDHINFFIDDHPRGKKLAFSVLGAYGYDADGSQRLWALQASHRSAQADWLRMLNRIPDGVPTVVLMDGSGPASAVAARWPTATPFIKHCEWHLGKNALQHLRAGTGGQVTQAEYALFEAMFESPADWAAFKTMAVPYKNLTAWCSSNDAQVTAQVAARASLPAVHSTGALEQKLARVRAIFKPRAFVFRNRARTDLLCQLIRNAENKTDVPRRYAVAIREHLINTGHPGSHQLSITDKRGHYSLHV